VDAGPVARDFLRALVGPGAPLTVTSHGLDKYGRVLAEVAAGDVDLSQALLAAGHAAPYALEDQLTA
jgi:endonuclease YncB( thermonuclease family)